NLGEAALLKKSRTLDLIAGAVVKGMEAQHPELTMRPAEIAAYAKAHHIHAVPVTSRQSPLMPWAVLAVMGMLMVVFRRRLIPAVAMLVAVVGLALRRF